MYCPPSPLLPQGSHHCHHGRQYRTFLIGSFPIITSPSPVLHLGLQMEESFKTLSQLMSPSFQSFSASHESSLKNIQSPEHGPKATASPPSHLPALPGHTISLMHYPPTSLASSLLLTCASSILPQRKAPAIPSGWLLQVLPALYQMASP